MMTQLRCMTILAVFAAILATSAASSRAAPLPAVGQVAQNERKTCAEPIRRQERAAGIPNQLLAAVALAESGRWDKTDSASFAWPWTVTAEGKGQFFATKAEAIEQVKQLRARGVRNIDVGCMQINLMHHRDAFADLEEALDPQANVAYATSFLKQLFEQSRSWITAVGNYHSATPEFHMRYRQKVTKLWNDERRRDAEARRQETIAAYQQRRLAATTAGETQMAAADIDDSAETQRNSAVQRLPAQMQQNGAVAASRPQLAPLPSRAPAPATSLRVQSQIPSAAAPRPAAAEAAAGRILPRTTAVPMERRF
jgi:hypothetical protein